jgi:hypothetical protein
MWTRAEFIKQTSLTKGGQDESILLIGEKLLAYERVPIKNLRERMVLLEELLTCSIQWFAKGEKKGDRLRRWIPMQTLATQLEQEFRMTKEALGHRLKQEKAKEEAAWRKEVARRIEEGKQKRRNMLARKYGFKWVRKTIAGQKRKSREAAGDAYKRLMTGKIWRFTNFADLHKPASKAPSYALVGPQIPRHITLTRDDFEDMSYANLIRVMGESKRSSSAAEDAFEKFMRSVPFKVQHATKSRDVILKSGKLLSDRGLTDVGIKTNSNTFEVDRRYFANDDFVFFLLSPDPGPSGYGPDEFIYDPEKIGLYEFGWISLCDFLGPAARVGPILGKRALRSPTAVRYLYELKKAQLIKLGLPWSPDRDYIFTVPDKGDVVNTATILYRGGTFRYDWRLLEDVFYGGHIVDGIVYSTILELRRIGGSYRAKALKCRSVAELARILGNLFFIEAKLPRHASTLFMRQAGTEHKFSWDHWDRA